MDGIHLGQYLPMESSIHRLDPRTKFLCGLFIMTAVVAGGWAGVLLSAILVATGVIMARIPVNILWRQVRLLGFIIILAISFQVFFTPGEAIFTAGPVRVSVQGLTAAIDIFIRLVLIIFTGIILSSTTSSLSLASGIEALLKPLGRLGIPVHEIVMAVAIAIRFVPVISEEARIIINAQTARGAGFYGPGPVRRVRAAVSLLVPLITGALRRSDELATAMEARCYQGGAGRTRMQVLTYTKADRICLLLSGTSLVAAVLLRITLSL
ncbi:MAG: energy-coupling factor transporter transmembrane component T family protein [Bacillota bacterium]